LIFCQTILQNQGEGKQNGEKRKRSLRHLLESNPIYQEHADSLTLELRRRRGPDLRLMRGKAPQNGRSGITRSLCPDYQ